MDFSIRLKQLRKENSITQEDLAVLLKVSKSSIGMYETGKRVPELATLEAIADYFNVDMDYLMGKSNIRNKDAIIRQFETTVDTRKDIHINTLPIDTSSAKKIIRKKFGTPEPTIMDRFAAYIEKLCRLDGDDLEEVGQIMDMKLAKSKYQN